MAMVGAGLPAAAQVEISTMIPDLSEGASPTPVEGRLELSLEDAIEIALQRNLGLIVQRYNDADSELDLEQSFGLYDLTATAELSSLSEASPSVSILGGADVSTTDTQTWNFGLSQLIMTGGSIGFAFNNTETDSNSNFATVNPAYRSDVDFTFTQPLLRNFGKRLTRRGIEIARTNLEISRETFAQEVTNSIQQVVNAYWGLVGSRAQLTVAQRSLELAQQLHDQNRVRVEVGTLAPLELVQSEAGIATREEEIIRARAAVADAEDVVRQLLNLDRDTYWDAEIVTTSEAETAHREVALGDAIEKALEARPEIVSKRLAFDNLALDSEYFSNQELPQLDLTARYGFNGLGGPVTQRDFITQEILFQAPGGYSDALDQLADGEFEGWRVALNLTYPIQNRSAEALSAKAEVAVDRATAELRDLELQIVTEVRKAVRGLETAVQQIDSARVSRRLQQRTLEAEQKRYDNGMSTSYRVLEIQRDLVDAANREVTAVTGYRTALAEFLRATGTLNEESGVTIVDSGL
jgi:outer membrane protein TolC